MRRWEGEKDEGDDVIPYLHNSFVHALFTDENYFTCIIWIQAGNRVSKRESRL